MFYLNQGMFMSIVTKEDLAILKLSSKKNSMVEFIDGDLYTSSWQLCQLFDIEHRSLRKTIQNNLQDLKEIGEIELKEREISGNIIPTFKQKKIRETGRPVVEYLLNEPQATFILLLLKGKYKKDRTKIINNITKFKKFIATEFFRQRRIISKLLVQKQNVEWLAKRDAGKLDRRVETDTIKSFVEYAKAQGSHNAEKYYMIISKMENQTLFCLEYLEQKFPNLRDVVDSTQLNTLQTADRIIAKAIKEGMESKLPYKEIYVLAKDRVTQFSTIIGKTPLQQIMQSQQLLLSTS
jgi:phage regulator Rha-like protein